MQDFDLKTSLSEKFQFLSGGGEMGAITREKDWSKTFLGPVTHWPQSLRTTLGIVLNCKFPMFLFWGDQFTCFYNDAYRFGLGNSGKHPGILGIPGQEALSENWNILRPLLDKVMAGHGTVRCENHLIRICRNDKMEEVYWTFNYSPVYDESQKIAGVLGIVSENTTKLVGEQMLAWKKIEESETEFRQLANSLPALVWTTNGRGEQTFASDRWQEFTGIEPRDDSTFKEIVHPEDHSKIIKIWGDALATGKIFTTQIRLKSRDGIFNWFYGNGVPIINKDGTIEKWIGAYVNIQDQKNAERYLTSALQKVKESETRFRNIADSAPALIWMSDANNLCSFVNKEWINFTGRTMEDEYGQPWDNGVHPDDYERCLALYTKAIDSKEKVSLQYRFKRKDGEYRWISKNIVPRFTENGIFEGFIGACIDIHEQVIAQKKVKESEEKLNIVIEASELGTWEFGLDNDVLKVSKRFLEIFGHEDLTDMDHAQFISQIHPDDLSIRTKALDDALQSGHLYYEVRIIRSDSSVHWIETKGKVFYNEANKPFKIVGTLNDITDEKQRRSGLEDSEKKFRLLAESMPQFIWTGDAEGNLNYFNQAVYNYSGLSEEEMDDGGWIKVVHPDDREENIKAWVHSITTGKNFLFEHRFRRNDGEYRWQLSRAVPQRDEAGRIQMWVGTSTDIQDIKEQDQQKDYFISLASHELKTPITSIKAYTQLLQSKYGNSKDAFLIKSLNVVDKQIIKLTNLIADLLDLSKIKSGSLTLHKENFEVNELIHEVIDEIEHINPEYHISFSKEVNVLLYADRERIGQVLINFLTNAIKYSSLSGTIEVESIIENNNLIVRVEDQGIGINKNDQERIFERFYRVEGKSEKTFPGFGIGLFISMEIVRRHSGTIGVSSEPGKGSMFYFSIPFDN